MAAPEREQKGRAAGAATRQGPRWSGAETDESELRAQWEARAQQRRGHAGTGTGTGTCRDGAWRLPALLSKPSSRAEAEQREKRGFFCLMAGRGRKRVSSWQRAWRGLCHASSCTRGRPALPTDAGRGPGTTSLPGCFLKAPPLPSCPLLPSHFRSLSCVIGLLFL